MQNEQRSAIHVGKSVHHFRQSNLADVEALERQAAARIKTLPDGSRENLNDGLGGAITLYDRLILALEGYDLTAPVEMSDADRAAELLPLIPVRHKELAINKLYDVEIAVEGGFSLFQKSIAVRIRHAAREEILNFERPAEADYRQFAHATVVRRREGREAIVTVERQPRVLVELFDRLVSGSPVSDAYLKCLIVQHLFGAFDDALLD
jgi:hypothetical protein